MRCTKRCLGFERECPVLVNLRDHDAVHSWSLLCGPFSMLSMPTHAVWSYPFLPLHRVLHLRFLLSYLIQCVGPFLGFLSSSQLSLEETYWMQPTLHGSTNTLPASFSTFILHGVHTYIHKTPSFTPRRASLVRRNVCIDCVTPSHCDIHRTKRTCSI